MGLKRKVIQLAGKTLVVSLPTKWAKMNGVIKGDEIEVTEDGSVIKISKESSTHLSKNSVDLDISGKKEMAKRMVASLYKAGVDEIRITYETPEEIQKVEEVMQETCMGYEIYAKTTKSLEIKNISKIDETQFEHFLKRTFHVMHTMADDCVKGIEEKDKELLFDVFSRDLTVNKLTDLCRRLINKNAYKGKNPEALYFIIEQLEKIADIFKDIGKKMSKVEEIKLSKELVDLLKEAVVFFRSFHDIFYTFNWKVLHEFRLKKDVLFPKIDSAFDSLEKSDLRVLSLIDLLSQQVYDLNGALIAYHTEL